jgi:hypothetical protein
MGLYEAMTTLPTGKRLQYQGADGTTVVIEVDVTASGAVYAVGCSLCGRAHAHARCDRTPTLEESRLCHQQPRRLPSSRTGDTRPGSGPGPIPRDLAKQTS